MSGLEISKTIFPFSKGHQIAIENNSFNHAYISTTYGDICMVETVRRWSRGGPYGTQKSHTAHRGKRNINHVERVCRKRPVWPRQRRLWLKLDSLRPLKNWPAKKWRCRMRTFLSLWTFFYSLCQKKMKRRKYFTFCYNNHTLAINCPL